MKTSPAIAALMILVSLLVTACGPSGRTPASPVTTMPAATTPAEPSYEDLVKGGFVNPSIPRILPEELKLLLDKGGKLILVDNRSESKFKMGHLPGAINIANAVDSPYPDAETTMEKELAALPDDTLKVLYCD